MRNEVDEKTAAELHQLMRALADGWNSGSAAAFVAGMTEHTHYVAFDGSVLEGAEEIAAFHQPAFDTHLKGTELQIDVTEMRALGENGFLVFATGGAAKPDGSRELTGDSVQTFVCERIGADLRVTVFQNTRVRPLRGPGPAAVWRSFDTLWETFVERSGPQGGPPPGHR